MRNSTSGGPPNSNIYFVIESTNDVNNNRNNAGSGDRNRNRNQTGKRLKNYSHHYE